MTNQSTTSTAADSAKNAVDKNMSAASKVAADNKNTADEIRNAATDTGKEVAERTVAGLKEASDKAATMTTKTQKSLGENIEKLSQGFREMGFVNKRNFEAFAKSSEITVRALENFGGEVAAYTKRSHEDRVAAAKDISGARTMAELVEKQTSFAQHAFEEWAQQAIKLNAIYSSATKDIAGPLGERASAATEEMRNMAR